MEVIISKPEHSHYIELVFDIEGVRVILEVDLTKPFKTVLASWLKSIPRVFTELGAYKLTLSNYKQAKEIYDLITSFYNEADEIFVQFEFHNDGYRIVRMEVTNVNINLTKLFGI